MKISNLTGHITYQIESNGTSTDERIKSLENALVPSAAALTAALKELNGLSKTENDNDNIPSEKGKPSTMAYHFEIPADKAILALQKIDKEGNTDRYDAKKARLDEVRAQIGTSEISKLPLDKRIEAVKALNAKGFRSYSYQVHIKVPGEGTSETKFIRSKKHHRLEALSEEAVKAILEPFGVKWINKPDPDKEKEEPSSSQG